MVVATLVFCTIRTLKKRWQR
ncbi:hypothetical protein [Bacillus xiapuensis]